ncbi:MULTISPECIES: HIG1 domain-containing protein [unclassified Novosphingobium]|jgi:hypothetical protein|uniref:HIG1 domain-containing protein n=1 Tax=unclassified Novosphingobium TaxID=2644732 RepID=UPI00061BB661|nr:MULTISPECIES: HIG1 domain-containing protein [unclassified Novosphingobium]MBF5090096.1 hypothetical protein [Novosphingobium sp. NBM11]RQW45201.1 hypothetical protein EH199_04710 [Novosphingobium sp. LASN5T]GAO54084.1 hypothetical protein NMD1_01176 [Novosphingobium sp. MD-1]
MKYVLIPLLIVLMAMAVISLVRGIIAFLKSTREDLERGDQQGATEMQLLQNKMMFNRIKYQGLAVLVVVILLAASR